MTMLRQTATVVAAAVVFALAALPAPAAVVNLGGGWQASWDTSLDGLVDVIASDFVGDTLFIEKSINFRQAPVNGIYSPVLVQFQQIEALAATHIVIDDEALINSSGMTWSDFHMELQDDSGGTKFDPYKTAASGGTSSIGFSISPFKLAAFTSDQKKLDIWDGTVPSGTTWWPGSGSQDGQLWINVTPGADNSGSFRLLELPTTTGTPEPATMSLLALGGLALIRRRS